MEQSGIRKIKFICIEVITYIVQKSRVREEIRKKEDGEKGSEVWGCK
jgi:hypothetical protein